MAITVMTMMITECKQIKHRQQLKPHSIKSSSTLPTKNTPLLTSTVLENNQVTASNNGTSPLTTPVNIAVNKAENVNIDDNSDHVNVLSANSRGGDNDNTNGHDDSSLHKISHTGRLFVRNVPCECTEDELNNLFTTYGPISEVHIPLDTGHSNSSSTSSSTVKKERQEDHQKRVKSYGFVQFMIPEHATQALQSIDGTSFQGRLLHIIAAKDKKNDEEEEINEGSVDKKLGSERGREYQQKKEKERRSMAGQKDSWNASYVRSYTVVASLAEK